VEDRNLASTLSVILAGPGYRITSMHKIADAVTMAKNVKYDLLIVDLKTRQSSEDATLHLICDKLNDHNILFLTSQSSQSIYRPEMLKDPRKLCLTKPQEPQTLLREVAAFLQSLQPSP
jgi:DNA-binding response OmpR family regulator